MKLRIGILLIVSIAAAQDQDPSALWTQCGSGIDWIKDTPPPRTESPRWQPDAGDRGELWKSAVQKAKELGRPILLYLYRIDGKQMYRAPCLDNYMMNAVFTDPDVVDFVRRRFVAARMLSNPTLPLNIRPPDSSGVGTLEPALVFADSTGKVIHTVDRIRTFNADWVLHVLQSVLSRQKAFESADPEELIKAGECKKASALLSGKNDARSQYLLAIACRRMRDADGAKAALKKAAGSDKEDLQGDVWVETGLVFLREGNLDRAREAFDKAGKATRLAEAMYYRACIDFMSRDEKGAAERFRALASKFPASPWGWRAAAELVNYRDTTPEGPVAHSFLDLFWYPAAAYVELPTTTGWARDEKSVNDLARRGVLWLLRQQRSTGGFADARYAFWDNPKILPNVRCAATALAAAALLEWQDVDQEAVGKAIEAAEKFIFDDSSLSRGSNEECYAEAYRIFYLSRKLAHNKGRKADIAKQMTTSVERLAKLQGANGMWAHEYPNPFATAAVMQCLALAKEAGVGGTDELMKKGAAALQGGRGDAGTQPYSAGRKASAPKDSSGRIVLCEAAIFLAGAGPVDHVRAALDVYWQHFDRQEKVRKCDFHTDGELGGFFFLHNLFHTSQSVKLLPKGEQPKQMEKFLREVVKLAELDGSFIDDHELGKCYGTAAGLLVLKAAAPGK